MDPGRGRGRGATLPAWMTKGSEGGTPGAVQPMPSPSGVPPGGTPGVTPGGPPAASPGQPGGWRPPMQGAPVFAPQGARGPPSLNGTPPGPMHHGPGQHMGQMMNHMGPGIPMNAGPPQGYMGGPPQASMPPYGGPLGRPPMMGPPQGHYGPPPGMAPYGGPPRPFPTGQMPPNMMPPQQGPPGMMRPMMGGPGGPGGPYGAPPGLQQPMVAQAAGGPQPGVQPTGPAMTGAPTAGAAAQPVANGATTQPVSAAAAAPAGKVQWTEHKAPDGRMYYYNATTKTSVWTKPPELQAAQDAAAAAANDWKEYSAPDGRKYYHNKTLNKSVWTMPEEMKRAQAAGTGSTSAPAAATTPMTAHAPAAAAGAAAVAVNPASLKVPSAEEKAATAAAFAAAAAKLAKPATAAAAAPAAAQDVVKKNEEVTEVKEPEPKEEEVKVVYATKEAAKEAFKELLYSVGCASSWTWEQAMRVIITDRRFGALKTLGEKKACFNEFLQQRKKEERDEARLKIKQIRDDFLHMLEACPQLTAASKFSKARDIFELDPRWKAVEPREREELFADFLKERERQERESRKAEVKKKQNAFKELLKRTSAIKVNTPWRKAQQKLDGESEYEALEKVERLEVYEDYIRDLYKQEREEKEKERAEKKRQERHNRDAFKEFLEEQREAGYIHAKTRWREYGPTIAEEPAYLAVAHNSCGSTPRELFQDVLEQVEAKYEKDIKVIKAVYKDKEFDVESYPDAIAFREALQEADKEENNLEDVVDVNFDLYHAELVGKLHEKRAKEEKRAKRALEDYSSMLRHNKYVRHDSVWEDVKEKLAKEPEYKAVASEEDRQALFEELVAKLKAKRDKELEREREREKERERREKEREKERELEKKRKHYSSDEEGGAANSGDSGRKREEKKSKRHKKDKKKRHKDSKKRRSESPGSGGADEGDGPRKGDEAPVALEARQTDRDMEDVAEGE